MQVIEYDLMVQLWVAYIQQHLLHGNIIMIKFTRVILSSYLIFDELYYLLTLRSASLPDDVCPFDLCVIFN